MVKSKGTLIGQVIGGSLTLKQTGAYPTSSMKLSVSDSQAKTATVSRHKNQSSTKIKVS